ncbi:MAG: pseudouridine synthase [Patescibacteria group bacterium]|nr:pseudouridine synthase [Patescibacteria group bacterium]MDD4304888.1 pseudouridine synthase [Patescibacteria group bacterium]MDD4695844.1 pseudouridine synthase [Patescibacteria group bacterium]
MRINKFLAQCNLGSRRKVEELVKNGEIIVNNKIISDLGTQVNENDEVKYKNKILKNEQEKIYIAINKPVGYIVTKQDDYERKTIYDLLPSEFQNLKYVGRLDYTSEGLIIMTNDGDFIEEITHPKYKLQKIYEVILNKTLTKQQIQMLRDGIIIEDKKTKPAKVNLIDKTKLEITIFEGRKRQIREMIKSVGSGIINLKRIQIGNLELGNIHSGKYIFINKSDI